MAGAGSTLEVSMVVEGRPSTMSILRCVALGGGLAGLLLVLPTPVEAGTPAQLAVARYVALGYDRGDRFVSEYEVREEVLARGARGPPADPGGARAVGPLRDRGAPGPGGAAHRDPEGPARERRRRSPRRRPLGRAQRRPGRDRPHRRSRGLLARKT